MARYRAMTDADKAAVVQKLKLMGANSPARGQGLSRVRAAAASGHVSAKVSKAAGSVKPKKKDSGGGGGFLGTGVGPDVSLHDIENPFMEGLKALDLGRRAALGTIVGAGDVIGGLANGKIDFTNAEKAYGGELGVGDLYNQALKNTGLKGTVLDNKWVRRGVGLAGDIATDPLTYLAPGAGLAGGSEEVASRIAAQGAERGLGQDVIDQLVAKVGKHGASSLTEEEALSALGTKGGLHANIPGTGKQVRLLPKSITDRVTHPLAGLRTSARESEAVQAVLDRVGGNQRELIKGIQSGDAARASGDLAAKRLEASVKIAARSASNGHLATYVKDIRPLIKGNESAVIHAIESGNAESVKGAAELRDFLQSIHAEATANGVPLPNLGDQYVPRQLTPEGRASAVGEGKFGSSYDPTGHRTLTPELGGTQADTRASMENYAKETLGIQGTFFEKNPDKLIPAYLAAIERKTALYGTIKKLTEQGVIKDAQQAVDVLDPAATKAAQKEAGLKGAKADVKAAASGADAAAAAQAQSVQDVLARAYETPTAAPEVGQAAAANREAVLPTPDAAASLNERAAASAAEPRNARIAEAVKNAKSETWTQVTVPSEIGKAAKVRWTLDGVEGAPVGTKAQLRQWARDELGKQGVDLASTGARAGKVASADTAIELKSAAARALSDAVGDPLPSMRGYIGTGQRADQGYKFAEDAALAKQRALDAGTSSRGVASQGGLNLDQEAARETARQEAIRRAAAAVDAAGSSGVSGKELADILQQEKGRTEALLRGDIKPGQATGIPQIDANPGEILRSPDLANPEIAGQPLARSPILGGPQHLPAQPAAAGAAGAAEAVAAPTAARTWSEHLTTTLQEFKAAGAKIEALNPDGTASLFFDTRIGNKIGPDRLQNEISTLAETYGVSPDSLMQVERGVEKGATKGGVRVRGDRYTIDTRPLADADLAREIAGVRPALPAPDASAARTSFQLESASADNALSFANSDPKALQLKASSTADHAPEASRLYEAAVHETDPHLKQVAVLEAQRAEADAALATARGKVADIKNISSYKIEQQMIDELHTGAFRMLTADPSVAAPTDIADHLEALSKVSTPDGMRAFLKHYDQLMNYIKAWQISTPGFHLRNFMGGTFNNFLGDMDMSSYFLYHRGVKGRLTTEEEKSWFEQTAAHMDRGQYSGHEVQTGLKHEGLLKRLNPFSSKNAYVHFNQQAGGKVEEYLRGALMMDTLKKGGTIEDAIQKVYKFHFDYTDLSGFEKNAVKRVIPFYTWTRKNFPLQVQMMLERPGKYSWYSHILRASDQQKNKDGIVPSYFSDLFASPTGINIGGGQAYVTPDLPFTQTMTNALPISNGHLSLDNYASMLTPIIKTPIERAMGHQFFKGIPFQDKKTPAPAVWDQVPGLGTALRAVGVVDSKGNTTDRGQYTVEQFLPLLSRLERLHPSQTKHQERALASWLSFLGVPLRVNTKYEQQIEKFRQQLDNGTLTKKTVLAHKGQKYAYVGK